MQVVYKFGAGAADGDASMVQLLGGKGAHLAEMAKMGIPVPPGFTVPTSFCVDYMKAPKGTMKIVMPKVLEAYKQLSDSQGFWPLLVSVRSGAAVSLPGMMDTILNVGMTEDSGVNAWRKKIGLRAALDCRRRLIQMLGATAYGVPSETFEALLTQARFKAHVKEDRELDADALGDLELAYLDAFRDHTGCNFPETVEEQMTAAVEAVFKSWNNERAKTYRKLNGIDDGMGTAVTIQTMVFGNLNDDSGSGVLFTRHPSTGAKQIMGEFLPNAQGEDVVAGIRTPLPLSKLNQQWPAIGEEIVDLCAKLEAHYDDMMDVEFTVEDGKLYLLQCRSGKRSALAKLVIARSFLDEGKIDLGTALRRFNRSDVRIVLQPQVDAGFKAEPAYVGIGSNNGVAAGVVVLTAEDAINCKVPCVLVRDETDPDDIGGMAASVGVLTRTGGATSHAAVVARAMDKPCVVGCTTLPHDMSELAGRKITIDGATGRVWLDADVPVIDASDCAAIRRFACDIALRDQLRVELGLAEKQGLPAMPTLFPAVGFDTSHDGQIEALGSVLDWSDTVVDLRGAGQADPTDGLDALFAASAPTEPTPPLANVGFLVHALTERGAVFAAHGVVADLVRKHGGKVVGGVSNMTEALPALVADWLKAAGAVGADVAVLKSALSTVPVTEKVTLTAAPPAYILMSAIKEG